MNSCDTIDIKEEFQILPEIKTEIFDYGLQVPESDRDAINTWDQVKIKEEIRTEIFDSNSEPSECNFEYSDKIEIGTEFKTEPSTLDSNQDENAKLSVAVAGTQLIFCSKCKKTWMYSTNCKRKCLKCRSSLLYKCGECMKAYKGITNLLNHYCDGKPKFICDQCNYKTNRKSNFFSHFQAKHSQVSSDNKCRKCGKCYLWEHDLIKHIKVCSQTIDFACLPKLFFQCDHCNHKSRQKSKLAIHIQLKHGPKNSDFNKCKKCGKTYSCSTYFKNHLKFCGKPKSLNPKTIYTCDHCKYKTDHKSTITDHIVAKHLPKDPNSNKCKSCARSFSKKSNLNAHLKICGKSKKLNVKGSRATELRKDFCCDHCGYGIHRKDLLVRHMQSKHLNDSFPCVDCGKSYRTKRGLYDHASKTCKKRRK